MHTTQEHNTYLVYINVTTNLESIIEEFFFQIIERFKRQKCCFLGQSLLWWLMRGICRGEQCCISSVQQSKDICSGDCWHCKRRRGTRSCRSRARGFSEDLRQAGLAPHPAEALRFTATGFQGTCWRNLVLVSLLVFIRDCFEDELVPVFASVGKIYELRLMIEFSGTNRTYCYVRCHLVS